MKAMYTYIFICEQKIIMKNKHFILSHDLQQARYFFGNHYKVTY